jgi:pilus assembly protein CpaB
MAKGLAGAKAPPPAPVVVAAAPPPIPTQQVLVADHELTVGQRILASDMVWSTWPASAVNAEYVTAGPPSTSAPVQGQIGQAASKVATLAKAAVANPADGAGSIFVGAIVRERINRNEPLITAKVVRAGQSGVMAVTLDPGMRAVALPLTAESAAGGFILPGDHVDVIQTRQLDVQANGSSLHTNTAATVMRNVRVLAIDQNMGAAAQPKGGSTGPATSAIGATATVEATPDQAEKLVLAKASGSLTLSLRSYADTAGGAQIGSQPDRPGAGSMVRIYRSSTPTLVAVTR